MCCFARAVKHVAATKIFSRLTGRGTQYLAYQMEYESDEPNAMILPIPVTTPASESSVKFIDLSAYEKFFDDLEQGFPVQHSRGIGCSALSTDSMADSRRLHVERVGNFVASFVPSIADFSRLDPRFAIPADVWQKIPEYSDYGFAVFQLENLAGKPHPMAFEFNTRSSETFFPTVHIHDGDVHEVEKFDHALYLQHAGYDSVVSKYQNGTGKDRRTGLIRSKTTASEFFDTEKAKDLVAPDLLIHKTSLTGQLPNRDFTYHVAGSSTVPSFNFQRLAWIWPTGTLALAAGWFMRRRMRIRAEKHETSHM